MKRYVRQSIQASSGDLIEAGVVTDLTKLAKSVVDKLFKSIDKAIDTVASWIDEDDSDSNNTFPNHFVLDVVPTNDGPIYRMLVKRVGEDDDFISLRFDMKSDSGEQVSEAATIKKRLDGESDEKIDERAKNAMFTMGEKLLKQCSNNEYEKIAEFRLVSQY